MKKVSLKSLHVDPRNSNVCTPDILDKLVANIQQNGFYPPLIVRPHPKKKDQFIIVDGHHRKLVLERLKHSEADCMVWEINDKQAQLYLATLNRLSGEDNPRMRAELLSSLCELVPEADLLQLIPESQNELEDLLKLLQLDEKAMMKNIQKQLEDEAAELPVVRSFVLTPDQDEVVQNALHTFQSQASQDPSRALVAVCQVALNKGDA